MSVFPGGVSMYWYPSEAEAPEAELGGGDTTPMIETPVVGDFVGGGVVCVTGGGAGVLLTGGADVLNGAETNEPLGRGLGTPEPVAIELGL